MNIAIVGSRSFTDYSLFEEKMLQTIDLKEISKIISGGAIGADTLAEQFCRKYSIELIVFKPNWSLGRGAGLIRNTDIVKACDIVIAFWDNESKGTLDSINKGKKFNKKVIVHDI